MSDMNYEKAFARLKINNDFICENNSDFNIYCCGECEYYYEGGAIGTCPMCLKKEIRDWTLYKLEKQYE